MKKLNLCYFYFTYVVSLILFLRNKIILSFFLSVYLSKKRKSLRQKKIIIY